MDAESGPGECAGMRASRLKKPRLGGLRRESLSSASDGRERRGPCLKFSSHTAEDRHRNVASDPDRVADDGG